MKAYSIKWHNNPIIGIKWGFMNVEPLHYITKLEEAIWIESYQ